MELVLEAVAVAVVVAVVVVMVRLSPRRRMQRAEEGLVRERARALHAAGPPDPRVHHHYRR